MRTVPDAPDGGGGRRVVVTGCAGFIGSQLSERLVDRGCHVVGVDCFTGFYERGIKERNLERLRQHPAFEFRELDLARDPLSGVLDGVQDVFHLAAQAGVRCGTDAFEPYVRHNVEATHRLMEEARHWPLESLVYASSSSVYGDAETDATSETTPLRPVSLYGVTKVTKERIADVYHRSYGVPVVGLRYFTVYGPRQRPDMAFTRFLERAVAGRSLPLIGDGRQVRDFTYVDDVVSATLAAARRGRRGGVYNVGGGSPVELREVIALVVGLVGRPIPIEHRPPGLGEARRTSCDGSLARRELGFSPATGLREGLEAQLEWVLEQPAFAASRLRPRPAPVAKRLPAAPAGRPERRRPRGRAMTAGSGYRVAKRALDVALTSLALVVLAPLLAIIAALVWLDDRSAPVLFRQSRCGLGGRTFRLLKFRTMVADAEAQKDRLRAESVVSWPDFRLPNDPRVTRIGRVLRKTSLDELPQLFNVLRGDMALVGPRPTSFGAETYELWQAGRLDHRPGVTGPWQVWGRDSMEFADRCRLEISFFRRPSLTRELWVMMLTFGALFRRTGVA